MNDSDKLTENIVIRASLGLKNLFEQMAQEYGTNSGDAGRRIISEAVKKWHIPGFKKISPTDKK